MRNTWTLNSDPTVADPHSLRCIFKQLLAAERLRLCDWERFEKWAAKKGGAILALAALNRGETIDV